MVISGQVWLLWLFLDKYGYYGYLWTSMVIMVISGQVWLLWLFLDKYGYYGYFWTSMVIKVISGQVWLLCFHYCHTSKNINPDKQTNGLLFATCRVGKFGVKSFVVRPIELSPLEIEI